MKKVILARLSTIPVPGMRMDLITSGMVGERDIALDDGRAVVSVNIPDGFTADLDALKAAIEEKLAGLPEIASLLVVMTAQRPPRARAGSASRPPPSTWRWRCARWGSRPGFWTPISTDRRCPGCSTSPNARRSRTKG
jgi:ATP-binding protein involved in chromosome partitioning